MEGDGRWLARRKERKEVEAEQEAHGQEQQGGKYERGQGAHMNKKKRKGGDVFMTWASSREIPVSSKGERMTWWGEALRVPPPVRNWSPSWPRWLLCCNP